MMRVFACAPALAAMLAPDRVTEVDLRAISGEGPGISTVVVR